MGHPALFAYSIGSVEVLLGVSVLLGLVRKVFYSRGRGLGLFLWSVPKGLPVLGPSHGVSEPAGLLYLVGRLPLITIETTYSPDTWTLDAYLSRRSLTWARVANFVGRREPLPPPEYMNALAPVLTEDREHAPVSRSEADSRERNRSR